MHPLVSRKLLLLLLLVPFNQGKLNFAWMWIMRVQWLLPIKRFSYLNFINHKSFLVFLDLTFPPIPRLILDSGLYIFSEAEESTVPVGVGLFSAQSMGAKNHKAGAMLGEDDNKAS